MLYHWATQEHIRNLRHFSLWPVPLRVKSRSLFETRSHCQFCVIQVKISCSSEYYAVFVNGQQAHTYQHRFTKLDDIDVFEIYGQLQLIFVHV